MDVWQDLKLAGRMLARSRGFAVTALLTLALGVAGTSAIFGLVRAVLLRALPFEEADRLVIVKSVRTEEGSSADLPFSFLDFEDLKKSVEGFEGLAAFTGFVSVNLNLEGEARRLDAELVSEDYFRMLHVEPQRGRTFAREESTVSSGDRVVLLGHQLWQSQFGRSAGTLGSTLLLNGESHRVIGILPSSFRGLSDKAEVWLPLGRAGQLLDPRVFERRGARLLTVAGRLRPGVDVRQAHAAVSTVAAALEKEHPESNKSIQARVIPLAEEWLGELRTGLLILLAGAFIVLVISCTNVANLLLVRAFARKKEFAIRLALGAGSRRMVRQLLSESLLLAMMGCLLGLLAAYWMTRSLIAAGGLRLPSFVHVSFDPLVVGFILVVSLTCGVGFGLVPVWIVSKTRVRESLAEGGKGSGGTGRSRVQSSLVVVEIALAVVLLVGAGLVFRSFQAINGTALGFQPEGLLTLRLDAKGERYDSPEALQSLTRQLLERLRTVPGVQSVAISGPDLPTDNLFGAYFRLEDRLEEPDGGAVPLAVHHVSPGYFSTLGIPLLKGRDFSFRSRLGEPYEIIVSEEMARTYWPDEDPIGKRMQFTRNDPTAPWFTVVGVAGNAVHQGLRIEEWAAPSVYFHALQFPSTIVSTLNVLLRVEDVTPTSLVPQVREVAREVAPDLPVYDVSLMEERLSGQTASNRLLMLLMGCFGAMSLILAAVGTYGVISYTVRQRTHDISIHVAFGAEKRHVLGMVLRRGAVLAVAGLLIGVAAAFFAAPLFESRLYQVASHDPLTFVGVPLLLLFVALAASLLPALRAMRIDPITVLRG